MIDTLVTLLVFLPLLGAVVVGLTTRSISVKAAQFITSGAMIITAVLSAYMFKYIVVDNNPNVVVHLASWFTSGALDVNWALKLDALTAVMLCVVTFVSCFVHIYSVGYMGHDPHPQRFMAYLSLFTFFMLVLVTSNNFVQVFVGWEGVGLCSYLLIGFWYKKPSACAAAMKAFIVNRVGDFGMALGLFAIYYLFGSLDFDTVFGAAESQKGAVLAFWGMEFHALTLICILLFIGAMGKSAQFGLHTWLPDAMEGPTPVSALIHAATMVTAGVFLVARCSALFEHSETALMIVTLVGAITCIFAATVAITQNDIKRVIAYSTCSQLGYMFFACGVSAYASGVFHLATHGFFKALLFLAAGSVIHAMSDEQDMRKMGGIWKKIPFTFAMMIIGTLAITGVGFGGIGFAGYYSKDAIIEAAYAAGHNGHLLGNFAFYLGVTAALLTSFYSWRLIFMTFFGSFRNTPKVYDHIHESPPAMTIPLALLAVGAIFSGAYGYSLGITEGSMDFWNGALTMLGDYNVLDAAHHVPMWVKYSPFAVMLIGLLCAWVAYIWMPHIPEAMANTLSPIYKFLLNKWYIDELYDAMFVRPAKRLGTFFWQVGDVKGIDRFGPNGAAWVSMRCARGFSKVQSGLIYHYAFAMLIGVVGFLTYFTFVFYK
jgi:NADH-quinone oxidoreductase subunit L